MTSAFADGTRLCRADCYPWNLDQVQRGLLERPRIGGQDKARNRRERLNEEITKRLEISRDILARTPVDVLDVHERPRIIFRVADNTWLDAIVR